MIEREGGEPVIYIQASTHCNATVRAFGGMVRYEASSMHETEPVKGSESYAVLFALTLDGAAQEAVLCATRLTRISYCCYWLMVLLGAKKERGCPKNSHHNGRDGMERRRGWCVPRHD